MPGNAILPPGSVTVPLLAGVGIGYAMERDPHDAHWQGNRVPEQSAARSAALMTAAGRAHVIPVGFRISDDGIAIEVGGHHLAQRRPLSLRNIETNPWVALVVDNLGLAGPWTARGVSLRGRQRSRPCPADQLISFG